MVKKSSLEEEMAAESREFIREYEKLSAAQDKLLREHLERFQLFVARRKIAKPKK
jgi:hypothetical protein